MKTRILDHTGDTEHAFDVATKVGLEQAEEQFKKITGLGFAAIVPSGTGAPGTLMKKFDPTAKEIIYQPQLKGG